MKRRRPLARPQTAAAEHDLVTTLFDLGRQVTGVLDFDDLLAADSRASSPG